MQLFLGLPWRTVLDDVGRAPHMQESFLSLTREVMVALACVVIPLAAPAADDAALTKDQIKVFLQTAEVIHSKPSAKGVTPPWRLTLSNGTITHDASFQP